MFDIGMMEMMVVGVLALIVVGPKELPKLLRTAGGLMRKARELTAEFRDGVETLAAEAEREIDPFNDLRKAEGLTPGMSPEEITDHILANREREANEANTEQEKDAAEPIPAPEKASDDAKDAS
jgi:sec-independent protein translocase protein TatB